MYATEWSNETRRKRGIGISDEWNIHHAAFLITFQLAINIHTIRCVSVCIVFVRVWPQVDHLFRM